ncbi:MAG: hypothetical protein H7256_12620 [Bdellovibrio sp.]|nr:hypothetical protein [Bdellovibrio sp.]
MKKFLISTMVVLMSVAASAQAKQISTDKALEALFKAAPTTMADYQDSKISLETLLSPLKNDLADFIATGMSLGDDGGGSKSLRYAALNCESLNASAATCLLAMDRTDNIGTTINFQLSIAQDGSMAVVGPVTAESDL